MAITADCNTAGCDIGARCRRDDSKRHARCRRGPLSPGLALQVMRQQLEIRVNTERRLLARGAS